MKIIERSLKGVEEITLSPIEDARGFFMRVYDEQIFRDNTLNMSWVQENHSYSVKKGTIRGLHFQFPPHCEAKLVRCIRGNILDIFVDLRKDSNTFGQWDSIELSENNHKMILIPRGFAHGYCTLVDNCVAVYKVDNYYRLEAEGGIIWNDETLNINWPVEKPILSKKDSNLKSLKYFVDNYGGIEL